MMAEWDGQHPTDGTIHAWIDGELDATDSARLNAHATECARCAARIAEARGLVAGATRVIGLLDDMPLPLMRPEAQPIAISVAPARGSVWRMLRVTPTRAAIAAVLIVAVGIAFTREHAALDQTLPTADGSALAIATSGKASSVAAPPAVASPNPASPVAAPVRTTNEAPSVAVAPAHGDSVLTSAIARRLATDQPARTVEAAQGAGIPSAPATVGNLMRMDTNSAKQVAEGRVASGAAVVAMGAPADRLMAKAATSVPADVGCYRIDPVESVSATWNGVPLPVDVALIANAGLPDANGAPRYAITPVAGGNQIGAWSRAAGDTLQIVLLGVNVTTSGVLNSSASGMTGMLRAVARTTAPTAQLRASASVSPVPISFTVRVAAHRIPCAR